MTSDNTISEFARNSLIASGIIALLMAVLFLAWPQIDLAISALYFDAQSHFYLASHPAIVFMRRFFIAAYSIWYIIILIFGADAGIRSVRHFSLNADQWLYLLLTALAGPLLVTNLILKNNWGRARPRSVEEFGGVLEFSPPLWITDACETNCSFVSGEPSSMFMLFIPFAFLFPNKRWIFVAAALIAGSASGWIRIVMGGHFISDVIFAFIAMMAVAAGIYLLMHKRLTA